MSDADDDLRRRVGNLERVVAALRDEVARLAPPGAAGRVPPTPESARRPPAAAPAPPPTPPSSLGAGMERPRTPRPSSEERASRLEHLVGRYGVLALATLTIIAAVGTFVSWAAMHGLLGPSTRVVLGLMLAAGLAAAGLRLRRREPSFGSALLALALVVVEVCAWAAGPGLRLIPDPAAFALAAVASAALAAYARLQTDEALWCIGVAGAAVAPFVATDRAGSALGLALYGAGVGVAAAAGIGRVDWPHARRTLAALALVYAAALQLAQAPPVWGPMLGVGVPFAILLAGVLPFTSEVLVRPRLRAQGIVAGLAAVAASALVSTGDARRTALLLMGGLIVWLAVADHTRTLPAAGASAGGEGDGEAAELFAPAWFDGAWIPLLFATAAAYAWPAAGWGRAGVLAAAAVAGAAAVSRRGTGASRDALSLAVGLCALGAGAAAPWVRPIGYPITNAALAVLFMAALRWRPSASWLAAGAMAMGAAAVHTWILMAERVPFRYVPFATRPSLAALAVLAACLVGASWSEAMARGLAAPDRRDAVAPGGEWPGGAREVQRWALAAPWVWAFVWAHRELAAAWSPSIATFALVSLEVAVAVALVWVGRQRDTRLMRHAGLLLAVVAAVRALTAVHAVASVSLRIASYLVVSAFLLGIAYLYRRRGQDAGAAADRVEI